MEGWFDTNEHTLKKRCLWKEMAVPLVLVAVPRTLMSMVALATQLCPDGHGDVAVGQWGRVLRLNNPRAAQLRQHLERPGKICFPADVLSNS